jgi:hypothetical protein
MALPCLHDIAVPIKPAWLPAHSRHGAAARCGKISAHDRGRIFVKGIVAFLLFTQLMAALAVLAAARLRKALKAPGVAPARCLVIALQLWLPMAAAFVLIMNVVLAHWTLPALLAVPLLVLALLLPGVALAWLLLQRAVRRASRRPLPVPA